MKGDSKVAIYKDKKRSTYYFSVYVDVNGEKKRFVRRGFKNRQEARLAEADFLLNFDTTDDERITFETLAEMYKNWYKKRRKESSYKKIKSVVDIHLNPFFKKKYIGDITKRDVIKLHDKLLDKKLSVTSVKKAHTVLSSMLNYAIKTEYLKVNVAREAGNLDIKETKRFEFWTIDEFKQFISTVDDLMYRTLFMTLFYSGMRKGEALALTWKDVDFENSIIDINKTAFHQNITSTKTESSVRKVKMPQHTMNLLRELKLSKLSKINYVVFGEFYDHISESTLDRQYNHYVKLSKVKRIRIHDFRHSHASYLISLGNDIQVVSERLGHANTSTTYDIYAHLYPNAEAEAVAKMEDDFKPAEVVDIRNFK